MHISSYPSDSSRTPTFITPQKAHQSSAYSTQSTAYSQTRSQSQSRIPHDLQTSSALSSNNNTIQKRSPYQSLFKTSEFTVKDVGQRYEKDIESVQRRYEQHFNAQYELDNNVADLQDALELERKKVASLEDQLNEAFRGAGQDKRVKLELERENRDLREKLRSKDTFLSDYEQKARNLQESATSVSYENDSLRREIKKLNETCNLKIREVDEKYQQESKAFNDELENLRSLLREQDIDSETKHRGLSRELEAKIRTLENQIREKDRIIVEYNSEAKSQKGFHMKVKMEFEDELRKQVSIVKDEERAKYETTIKGLEAKCKQLEHEKVLLEQKVPELAQNITNKERIVKDVKVKLEDQIRALRKEIIDLQDKQSVDASDMERLQGDLRGKDSLINKAQAEILHLNNEIQRQKEIYIKEVDRLAAKNDTDQNRFQEYERQYREKMVELERNLKETQSESIRSRGDFERFREKVSGSLGVTIAQTFNAYGVQGPNNGMLY